MKLKSLEAIFSALNAAQVRYIVVGGLAVNVHGYLRFTKDLDLVLKMVPENIERTLDVLDDLGYRPTVPVDARQFSDPDQRKNWIEEKGMQVFQFWSNDHAETPIDLFVKEPFPFEEEYQRSLVKLLYNSLDVHFVSIPTLIDMKKTAGRDQDRIDIDHLLMRLEDSATE